MNTMKKMLCVVLSLMLACLMFAGCSTTSSTEVTETETTAEATTEPETSTEPEVSEEPETVDDTLYLGEYTDTDANTAALEIAKNDDGSYLVQLSIYRLTTLTDGVGTLSEEGMSFTATDAAGNPIGGTIVVNGTSATITITDSTWSLLENGTTFTYEKTSDTANVMTEVEIVDDALYIGEYTDTDENEPALEIAGNDDGTYTVQLTIVRLTSLTDGVGTLTEDGMSFTATDANGNPITALVTVDGTAATVTITDSTWSNLENGTTFTYEKTSDTPNIAE